MMPKSYPTSIRMTDELKGDLARIAAWRKWSKAATIINALEEWVAFQKEQMLKAKKSK